MPWSDAVTSYQPVHVLALLAWLLTSVTILVIGIVVLRKSRRAPDPRQRTPVEARVVRRIAVVGFPILEVQYRGPDGQPRTGRVKTRYGRHALLTDGAPTTVWMVPHEPADIILDPHGGTSPLPFFAGIVVIVLGGTQTLLGLVLLTMLLVVG